MFKVDPTSLAAPPRALSMVSRKAYPDDADSRHVTTLHVHHRAIGAVGEVLRLEARQIRYRHSRGLLGDDPFHVPKRIC